MFPLGVVQSTGDHWTVSMGLRAPVLALALLLSVAAFADDAGDVRQRSFQRLNEGVSAYNHGDYRRRWRSCARPQRWR